MRFTRAASAHLAAAVATALMAGACALPGGGDDLTAVDPGTDTDVVVAGPSATTADPFDQTAVRAGDGAAPDDSIRVGAEDPSATPAVPAPPVPSGAGTVTSLDRPDGSPAPTAPVAETTASTTASTVASTSTSSIPVTPDDAATTSTVVGATSTPSSTSSTSTPGTTTTAAGPVASPPEDLVSAEAYSGELLNGLRSTLELQPLTRQAEMDAFARDWSKRMAETGAFEHSNGPYGENIAYTTNTGLSAAEAADLFHQLWTESPGHYRNMTNEAYLTSGVGLYLTENGWYGTHVFGF